MSKIKKILICNHSHTDIGFTDYQDACFRQHAEFVEQALDLIEKTDNFPEEAKYKWTVETTGPFIEYLKNAKSSQIDRFIKWYKKGRIDQPFFIELYFFKTSFRMQDPMFLDLLWSQILLHLVIQRLHTMNQHIYHQLSF